MIKKLIEGKSQTKGPHTVLIAPSLDIHQALCNDHHKVEQAVYRHKHNHHSGACDLHD